MIKDINHQNILPPSMTTWLELWRSIEASGLLPDSEVKIFDACRYPENPDDIVERNVYAFDIWYAKAKAFDELYAALPTKEYKHENRKRVYMLKTYNTTLLQNLIDFINSIPTK